MKVQRACDEFFAGARLADDQNRSVMAGDTLHHYTRLTIADLKKTHARCHPRERES